MRSLIVFLCFAPVGGFAADPPAIRLPEFKAVPVKGVPLTLTKDLTYVIDADVPFLVKTVPPGMVKVVPEESPFTIKTWFADSPTAIERRTYKGKHIFTVEPVKDGEYELLVIPESKFPGGSITAKIGEFDIAADGKLFVTVPVDDAGIVRRSMKNGTAPRPPPIPPKPDDPPPGPVTSFRVIFGYESATLTPAINNVMNAKAVEDYLKANTTPEGGIAGYRRFDKDTDASKDQPTMAALWAAIKPKVTAVPFLAIEINGDVKILPYPPTPAECLSTLKRYREGK